LKKKICRRPISKREEVGAFTGEEKRHYRGEKERRKTLCFRKKGNVSSPGGERKETTAAEGKCSSKSDALEKRRKTSKEIPLPRRGGKGLPTFLRDWAVCRDRKRVPRRKREKIDHVIRRKFSCKEDEEGALTKKKEEESKRPGRRVLSLKTGEGSADDRGKRVERLEEGERVTAGGKKRNWLERDRSRIAPNEDITRRRQTPLQRKE